MSDPSATRPLLDAARSEAVRRGHAAVTPLHVAVVLAAQSPDVAGRALGPEVMADVEARLAALPRTYASPTPDADVERLLADAAGRADLTQALADGIRAWLGSTASGASDPTSPGTSPPPPSGEPLSTQAPPDEPAATSAPDPADPPAEGPAPAASAPTAPAFTLPERLRRSATVVVPRTGLVPRADVVDAVMAAIGSRTPSVAVVVGPEGSGRTTVAECIAARLLDPTYAGPLAGRPVVLVRAEGIISSGRAGQLAAVLEACAGKAVVVVDDLEVLLAIGSPGGADLPMLAVVRSASGDPDTRLVATLASEYADRFSSADREAADEFARVPLPVMTDVEVRAVADQAAAVLGGYHRVEIPADVVAMATGPRASSDVLEHPGLAVERLDRAATACAARGGRSVTADDLPRSASTAAAAQFDAAGAMTRLSLQIQGQDDVLRRVLARLTVTRAGLDMRPERPDGVFLFAGPTGTGKTATALALAGEVFGDPSALIRLDMSEFAEEHTVSNLVGSPPGYVGSTEPEGWLTTKVRERPQVLLLLDEIEKAHPRVWNTFLQVFDAGRLTDRQGRTADFGSVVVVMTTNIGAEVFDDTGSAGFVSTDTARSDESGVMRAVRQRMAPELINRFDDIMVFRPLTPQAVRTIAERQIGTVVERLARRGWNVRVDASAVDLLARRGYDPAFGARPLQREIEVRFLQQVLAHPPGDYLAADEGGELVITPASADDAPNDLPLEDLPAGAEGQ